MSSIGAGGKSAADARVAGKATTKLPNENEKINTRDMHNRAVFLNLFFMYVFSINDMSYIIKNQKSHIVIKILLNEVISYRIKSMNRIKKALLSSIATLLLLLPGVIGGNIVYAQQYTCTGGGLKIPSCSGDGLYKGGIKKNPIVVWMVFFINTISAIIGFGAIIMIIIAGIEYSSAGDNPSQVQSAKKKITNVFVGLALYISFYALMNWIVPGGVL